MPTDNNHIKEKIKEKISFEDKFREYYPEKYRSPGNSFSPFRDDTTPSFQCNKDFGYDHGSQESYDIFALHEHRFNCDFQTAFEALRAEAGISDPPKRSRVTVSRKEIVAYDYEDEKGQVIYQNVRFEPKDFRARRPDPDKPGEWIWDIKGIKRIPFKLPELLAAPKDQPVLACEGEKDALAMIDLGFVATSVGSASNGCGTLGKHGAVNYFKDKDVIIVADKDDNGLKYAQKAAVIYAKVAKSVKIIEMPGEGIKDPADFYERHGADGKATIESIVAETAEYEPDPLKPEIHQSNIVVDKKCNPSKLTKFQNLDICFQGSGWKLFFDQNGEPWTSVHINGHNENMRVDSQQFKRLVRKEFKAQFNDGVGFNLIDQVIDARLGEIEHTQAPHPLHVRMCWNATKDRILIDSGRPDWAVFEIGPYSWRIVYMEQNPFKRARKTAAYSCTPETTRATWNNLFEFVRLMADNQRTIVKMWLCLALFPETARPGLIIQGPHGTAKTTLARKLKMLVDPATNERPNRFRKNEDDMIAPLANYAVSVLDNANQMTQEQSDLLCLSITGVDDEKRKLFTDGDLHNTDFMTTWIITGLNNPGKMGDFLSRVFIVETEIIPKNEKIPDDRINELSQTYTAGIQALIFDCMSQALKNRNSIKTDDLNRMAQANIYSLAMADALGLNSEEITAAWSANRNQQRAEEGSGEILTELVPKFLKEMEHKWQGRTSDMFEKMYSTLEIDDKPWKKSFPSTPEHLGRRLNKIIGNLREQGIVLCNSEDDSNPRQMWDTSVYEENPFPRKPRKVRKGIAQQDLLNQASENRAPDNTTDPTCNGCEHYGGHDYCDHTGGVADPDNCTVDSHYLKPTGLK